LIPTTDIRSSGGYNPSIPLHLNAGGSKISADYSNQDYTIWFNGTSAAAPHVAGIAALVFSWCPKLTQPEVRQAIEASCQKINQYHAVNNPTGYVYISVGGRPNGTWNNQVGYGLVDAHAAVQTATCVITFTNQTVSTNRTVIGCNNLSVQNVTVSNNAKLWLDAPGNVRINGNFSVPLGSSLSIK